MQYAFGRFRLDDARRVLLAGDELVPLTPRVFDTLLHLVEHHGELCSKDELLRSVWPDVVVDENNLSQNISTLRHVLGEKRGEHSFILTVAGRGFRFVAPVTRVTEAAPVSSPAVPGARGAFSRKALLSVCGIAAVAMATIALIVWFAPARNPAAPPQSSVALLPFVIAGDDADLRSFTDGLQEELVTTLTTKQVLAVSREDSGDLQGSGRAAALNRLKVALVLDGGVTRGSSGLEVRVHLDDVREHVTVWSHEFRSGGIPQEAFRTRISSLVVDIARAALEIRRTGGERVDATSLTALLHGTEIMTEPGLYGEANRVRLLEARNVLQQAARRMPDYARGHALLAAVISRLAGLSAPAERLILSADATREAETAIALDPSIGEAYTVLAAAASEYRGLAAEEAVVLKGMAAAPQYPELYNRQSALLQRVGRMREALQLNERALALHPAAADGYAFRIMLLANLGRVEEARGAFAEFERRWAGTYWIPPVRLWLVSFHSTPAAGLAAVNDQGDAFPMTAANREVWRRFFEARQSGRPDDVDRAASAIIASAASGALWRVSAMETLVALGRIDQAYEQADLALAGNMPGTQDFPWWAWFNTPAVAMRSDPRFMELARRRGLTAYWLESNHWPDFCAEPGLPYDCRVEAARVNQVGR